MNRTLLCISDFRNAVVDALVSANIDGIGGNVFAARLTSAWPEEESYVVVNTSNTNFDDGGTHPRFYKAVTDLTIDVYARAYVEGENNVNELESPSDLNDFLDAAAKAIIDVIDPCRDWKGPYNGLVSKCVLKSYTNNLSSMGETDRGTARITYSVSFSVQIDKTAPVTDFLRAKNSMKNDGGDTIDFTTNLRPST